jgi:hypothetical protein
VEISPGKTVDAREEVNVCSGCSGDYTGGFDDSGELDIGNSEDLPTRYRGETLNDPASRSAERSFGDPRSQIEAQPARQPQARAEAAEPAWEVLVSETRIVEVHVFGGIRDEVEYDGVAPGSVATLIGHSYAESAKRYLSCSSAEAVPDAAHAWRTGRSAAAALRKFKARAGLIFRTTSGLVRRHY